MYMQNVWCFIINLYWLHSKSISCGTNWYKADVLDDLDQGIDRSEQ